MAASLPLSSNCQERALDTTFASTMFQYKLPLIRSVNDIAVKSPPVNNTNNQPHRYGRHCQIASEIPTSSLSYAGSLW